MGGDLVSTILKEGQNKLKNVQFLVLGPHGDEEKVRRTIVELGFKITDEKIVHEDHFYQIILCSRGEEKYSSLDYEFGPVLRKRLDENFVKMYLEEIDQLNKLCLNPNINNTKKDQFLERINLLKSVLEKPIS